MVFDQNKEKERDYKTIGPFIRGKIRRELYHLYEHVLSNKTRLILDEMCCLYGKFTSYLRRILFFLV